MIFERRRIFEANSLPHANWNIFSVDIREHSRSTYEGYAKIFHQPLNNFLIPSVYGRVAERLKAAVSKTDFGPSEKSIC
jgi:hypothetical protein